MNTQDPSMAPSDRCLRRAAAWRIRLQYAEFTQKLHARWEAWIEVPENQRAFAEIEELWSTLDEARIMHQQEQAQRDTTPKLAERLRRRLLDAVLSVWSRPRLAITATANIAVLVFGAVALFSDDAPATTRIKLGVHPPQPQTMEKTSTELDSTFETAPQTEIDVKVNGGQRIVEVTRGKAVFRVANDPQRSMIVTTDLVRIAAVGTKFSVSNTDESVVVAVSEGRVELSPSNPETRFNGGVALTLYKNQQLILPKDHSESMLVEVAARSARN